MSFSGKKPFGWHVHETVNPTNEGSKTRSYSKQTFSAQSRRFFGFAPLPEEKVLLSLKARLTNEKQVSSRIACEVVPKTRIQSKRVLPRISARSPASFSEGRLHTGSLNGSSAKSRLSPLRSFSNNFDFSPYSSPTRTNNNSGQILSPNPIFNEYLGGIPDLVQLKSQSNVLDDRAFPSTFPTLHRLLTSNTPFREGLVDARSFSQERQRAAYLDVEYFANDSRSNRRIRFDDNVQRIASVYRPPSSSNGTDLSTVYIIEDVDSSGSSEIDNEDDNFEYDPDRERSMLAFRLHVLPDHPDLMWIVDECIQESSKDPWQLCLHKKSVIYHNRRTGEV
jgi:hypothetical protein